MRLREETSKVVSVPPNEWLNTVSCALNFKVVSVSPENYITNTVSCGCEKTSRLCQCSSKQKHYWLNTVSCALRDSNFKVVSVSPENYITNTVSCGCEKRLQGCDSVPPNGRCFPENLLTLCEQLRSGVATVL